jgi:putative Mg2+ transporter-C (MgtC) family protein
MIEVQLAGIWDQIQNLDWTPLVLAVVLGGLVGLEREVHGRPAGLRTHILVCLSSATLILASRHLGEMAAAKNINVVFDPQRLAAGIVTGIGFLGAAAVIKSGDMVRGITTGACVWSVAGIGVVVGGGSYGLACVATALFLCVLLVLDWVASGIPTVRYRSLTIRGQGRYLNSLAGEVRTLLKKHRMRVQDLSGRKGGTDDPFELVFHVRCRSRFEAPEMLDALASLEGVDDVEWSQLAH